MKKIGRFVFGALALSIFLVFSCENPASKDPPTEGSALTTGNLTIQNKTLYAIDFVCWTSTDGTAYYFEPDQVFDSALNRTVGGMLPGSSQTREVKIGTDAVYFYFADGGAQRYTAEEAEVEPDGNTTFTLTDETGIYTL